MADLTDFQTAALRALHDEHNEFGDYRYQRRGCFLRLWAAGYLRDLTPAEEIEQTIRVLDGLAELGLVRNLNGRTVPGLTTSAHALTSAGYVQLGEPVPAEVAYHETQAVAS